MSDPLGQTAEHDEEAVATARQRFREALIHSHRSRTQVGEMEAAARISVRRFGAAATRRSEC